LNVDLLRLDVDLLRLDVDLLRLDVDLLRLNVDLLKLKNALATEVVATRDFTGLRGFQKSLDTKHEKGITMLCPYK
ncbi:hypothetical protein, partial [uncultured Nostoc sp.]|uniref:hypothetical protein n=1 Tax=uncultured Nostoc sp. TaxID=340711 RepID=UPI0035CC7D09